MHAGRHAGTPAASQGAVDIRAPGHEDKGVSAGVGGTSRDLDGRGPTIVSLREVSDSTVDVLYRTVLQPSFPPNELIEREAVQAEVGPDGVDLGFVAVDEGEPVACLLGEYYPAGEILLIGYLASRPDQRGRGVGRALVATALDAWSRAAPSALVLLEVEDPRWHSSTTHGDPVARLRFYAREGARLLDIEHVQPALEPGGERVPHLLLLALGATATEVDRTVVHAFLAEYFAVCEGEPDPADDQLAAVLAQVEPEAGGPVPLLPPDLWPEGLLTGAAT